MKEPRKTLRDPDDIKRRVTGDIRKLNKRLLEIATRLDAEMRAHPISRTPPGMIVTSFYRKAVNTTKAIQLLKEQRLIEEAWILLRVLLETHVNLLYFLKSDPKDMCERYADAAVLDKLKHLRAVSFYEGTSKSALHLREEWEAMELDIQGRYSPQEVKAMRRNGFSGLQFENRAKQLTSRICTTLATDLRRVAFICSTLQKPRWPLTTRLKAAPKRDAIFYVFAASSWSSTRICFWVGFRI